MNGDDEAKQRREERRRVREEQEEIDRLVEAELFEKMYVKSAAQLLADAPTSTPFIIEDVIPAESIIFLAGRPGENKSWLAYDAAIAVSRARSWLAYEVPKKGKVLVLNYDNPSHELARRFRRLGMKPDDQIYFHSIGQTLPEKELPAILKMPDHMRALNALVSRVRPDLIIVDSFRQSHTAEEKSSSGMSRVMACLRELTAHGAAVITVHHLRKAPQGKQEDDEEPLRGSSEIEASADAVMLTRKGLLELKKTRGWIPKNSRCDYSVLDDGDRTFVRFRGGLEALESAFNDGPLGKREISQKLGLSRESADKLVKQALDAGVIRDVRVGSGSRQFDLVDDDA